MSITALLFYICAGLLFASSLLASALVVVGVQRALFVVYGLAALCAGLYQVFSGNYYLHPGLSATVEALRWQTAFAAIGLIFLTATIGIFCRSRFTREVTVLVFLWCVCVVVVNYNTEYGIRFANSASLNILELPWGELIYPLMGESGEYSKLFHWGSYAFLIWVVYQALSMLYRQDFIRGIPLIIYILIQLYCAIFGGLVDRGEIQFFYISGFATVILLMLVAFGVAIALRRSNLELGDAKQGWISTQARIKKLYHDNRLLVEALEKLPLGLQIIDRELRVIKKNDFAVIMGELNVECGEPLSSAATFESLPLKECLKNAFLAKIDELNEVCICLNHENEQWVRVRFVPLSIDKYNVVHTVVMLSEAYSEKYIENNAITQLAASIAQPSEDTFFDTLVLQLAKMFDAKYALISEISSSSRMQDARTLTVVKDGKKIDNFHYSLLHSPCENLLDCPVFLVPNNVQSQFPEDHSLADLDIDSYIGAAMVGSDGEPIGMLVVMDDKPMNELERKQALLSIFATRAASEIQRLNSEKEMRRLAYEDEITGLPNRLQLHIELRRIFAEVNFDHQPIFIYLLDLDFFKSINDTLGHEVGDAALRALAERLRRCLSKPFYLARFGGDEFFLIHYPKKSSVEILHSKALELMDMVAQPLEVGDHCLSLCASIGCAAIPEHAQNDIDTIRCVELALNKAKASGRSRYEIYDKEQLVVSNARFMVRSELRNAMERGELDLYVQPQLDIHGHCVGAEGLLRWLHPVRGFVSPDQFIPVAEESGLIHSLGDWVFERACQYLSQRESSGLKALDLSVNVSAWQLGHPDFSKNLMLTVSRYQIDPKLITLEVTESVLMHDVKSIITTFNQLREFGLRISLDDFGTGFSSLAYLRDLPLDELKIDRAFIAAMDDPRSEALVSSIIALARNLKLKIVAEGVETRKQREQLEALGCDYYQGYLYAKPMPETEYREWIKHHEIS